MTRAAVPLHPLVIALLDELPAHGGDWPASERLKWLHAAEAVFVLLGGEGEVFIELMPAPPL